MVNAGRNAAVIAQTSMLFLASLTGCSVQSPSPDTNMSLDAAAPISSSVMAGISGAASGRAGSSAASAATSVLPTKSMATPKVATAGSSGVGGALSANTAGAGGSTAKAGSGAPIAAAGVSGSAGAAGAGMIKEGAAGAQSESACQVAPITSELRSRYENMDNAYYQKYASANGVIVATGPEVADEAVLRYCRLLSEMVSNDKVRQAIIDDKMWFTMIDEKEQLSDLPQIARDYGTSLNQRARGLGGLTPTICAEDSIMCLPGDRWNGDCICPHETGHTLYSSGIAKVSDLSDRLTTITRNARSSGRLSNAYVWMDGNESGMMAWGVQVWYDCAINGTNGGYHSDINTRAELQKEMPDFYQFLSELLPADNQYKDCYAK